MFCKKKKTEFEISRATVKTSMDCPPQIRHHLAQVSKIESRNKTFDMLFCCFTLFVLFLVSVVTPEEKELMKMRAKLLATFR